MKIPKWLIKQYEERFTNERNAGSEISIDAGLPSVSIEMRNGESYYFQEHDADSLLGTVPENISPEIFLLAVAQNW